MRFDFWHKSLFRDRGSDRLHSFSVALWSCSVRAGLIFTVTNGHLRVDNIILYYLRLYDVY